MRILYQDQWLVAVDKPSGISVHRGWDRAPAVAMTVVRDAVGRYVWPVHRLDRSASGVLLFALERDAARTLHAMFGAGEVRKRYQALVRGVPPEEGVVDYPLRRTESGPRVEAVTSFRRLEVFDREDLPRTYALVELMPRTGRPHQIRRHMKHLSHPLIGDVRYGKGEHNRLFRDRFGLHRLFLHACEVTLPHPHTGETFSVIAPMPDGLSVVLDRLRTS